MKAAGNIIIVLFLFFSLLALSGNLYAKRRGADLIIQKKDGQKVRGELIAVKIPQETLLLMESVSSADMSININDVKVVSIVKKSKALKGAFYGLLIGGGIGFISPLPFKHGEEGERWMWAGGLGILGGLLGITTGAIIGAASGEDEIIQIEDISQEEIESILQKLSSKSRIN